MKSRFYLLSILSMAALVISAPAANAQAKERGARWSFAPNIYKVEQPRLPQGYDAPSTVRSGAMPQSSNFLGVDPGMLNSRPPSPVSQVAARPAAPQVTGRAFVPNTAFKPSFGQPIQPLNAGAPIQMAHVPPSAHIPQMAAPTAARPAAPAHYARRPVARPHSTRAVSGRLVTPKKSVGQTASPIAATYSTGYVPGGYLPAHSGSGNGVNTNVHGRIIKH